MATSECEVTGISVDSVLTSNSNLFDGSECCQSSSSSPVDNLMNVLWQAQPSRKCVVSSRKLNPRRGSGQGTADPISVTPSQIIHEFPNEPLKVSLGKLFCIEWREELGFKRSIIHNHVWSTKHKTRIERLQRKEAREKDLAEALKRHDQSHQTTRQNGDTLPESQRIYSVKVQQHS